MLEHALKIYKNCRAEPPPKLRDDCPKGSSGVGTADKPCLASGESHAWLARMGDAARDFARLHTFEATFARRIEHLRAVARGKSLTGS